MHCWTGLFLGTPGVGKDRLHVDIRRENLRYQNMNMEPLITVNEVSMAINRIRNKKAPGPDALNPEIWKVVWQCAPEVVLNIFNKCLSGLLEIRKNSSYSEELDWADSLLLHLDR